MLVQFSSDTIQMLMFVCPTVSESHFYECCHPCYKYLYTIVCMAEFKKCIVLNIFSHPKRIWASSCIYTWVGPDTFVARYLISDRFLMPNIRCPVWRTFDIRQLTGYPELEISRISGIRLVLLSGIRSDVENGRISDQTGYPAQP